MGIAADFVLIVMAGLIGGLIARALRLPLLVGYVAAGVLVGPHTAGPTVVQLHDVELLAEIGVALLLFSLGLELSFRDLQPVRRIAFLGGPVQIVLTAGLGAAGARLGLGMPITEAIWFGSLISVSSTVVVLKTLSEAGVTSTLASRVIIGLLVLQDLAVIPMLVILPQLADPDQIVGKLARAMVIAVLMLTAVVVVGRYLLPRLLRLVLRTESRELFLITVVATGVGVGYATYVAGLSFALGAFVAGLVMSESEYSHQALNDVAPIRDIFGLLFFVSVGMLPDPGYVISHVGQIAAVVLLTFTGKALIIGGITRAFGYVNMAPWIVGLGLAQIGEFSFVLARIGLGSGMLSKATYDLALTSTVLTMAFSPLVSSLALPMGRWWRGRSGAALGATVPKLPDETRHGHAVIAGYGRTGRAAVAGLLRAGIPVLVVEWDHRMSEEIAAEGIDALWGDITGHEILMAAQVRTARVLMLTIPDLLVVRLAAQRAREINPEILIIARATRPSDVSELRDAGVTAVIQPEFEGGIEMVRRALKEFRDDSAAASELLASIRQDFYEG